MLVGPFAYPFGLSVLCLEALKQEMEQKYKK
jgi:hypothetical protein